MIEGLAKVLAEASDIALCGSSSNPTLSMQALSELSPDVVLLDQSSGLRGMFHFIAQAQVRQPQSRVVLWIHELDEVESFRALQAGARGILKKTLPVSALTDCIRTVARGEVWLDQLVPADSKKADERRSGARLTSREKDIVALVARGLRNRQIGETLSITQGTVKVHLMHIFEKTGVRDRFELAVEARRLLGGGGKPAENEPAPRSG